MVPLRVRRALSNEINTIQDFYLAHPSHFLPTPQTKLIGDTIKSNRLLIVDSGFGSAILAVGALFTLTPADQLTYVAELSGMRVDGAIGGLEPLSIQTLLVALRVLGFVAAEGEALGEATNSLIAIVKKGNTRSRENLELSGFKPLATRADWLKYDEVGWNGRIVTDDWTYHYADGETVVRLIELMGDALSRGVIVLTRINNQTQRLEEFRITIDLPDFLRAADDFDAIASGDQPVDLVTPPPLKLKA